MCPPWKKKQVIAVLAAYLNHPVIHNNMIAIITELRREMRIAEGAHMLRTGNPIRLVDHFDEWLPSLFARIEGNVRDFVSRWVARMRTTWANDASPNGRSIMQDLQTLETAALRVRIDQTGFYPPV